LNTIAAARKIPNNEVSLLVAAKDTKGLLESVQKLQSIKSIIVHDGHAALQEGLAEPLSKIIVNCQKQFKFSHLIGCHSTFGKNLFPRVAAQLDVGQISDVIAIESEDKFVRSIYAGKETK
jgi:electron transfer flavoprotein alpha subunit